MFPRPNAGQIFAIGAGPAILLCETGEPGPASANVCAFRLLGAGRGADALAGLVRRQLLVEIPGEIQEKNEAGTSRGASTRSPARLPGKPNAAASQTVASRGEVVAFRSAVRSESPIAFRARLAKAVFPRTQPSRVR